jgi:hypothetical protein
MPRLPMQLCRGIQRLRAAAVPMLCGIRLQFTLTSGDNSKDKPRCKRQFFHRVNPNAIST